MITFARRFGALALFLAGAGLSSCGGGGSSGSPASPVVAGTPPPPVLVAGATYQFAGTEMVATTYASPSATNVNSNATYTYTANQTVNAVTAVCSPAQFDVSSVTKYASTQAPSTGELLQSATADTCENQTFSGATETLSSPASKSTTTGVDVSAGLRLGSGPYNESNTSSTTYVTSEMFAVYPLQTNAAITESLARTVVSVTVDANAAGTAGGGGTTTTIYNNDGSFTRTVSNATNGSQQQQTVNANGSAQQTVTPTTGAPTQTVIGLPSTGTQIPVTLTTSGVATNDIALDWYPGGVAPSPLALTKRTVVGPVALPASCGFVGTPPPVIETVVTSTNLDTFGSYATSNDQLYNANGINICSIDAATTSNYTVTTGVLSSTTVTTQTQVLVASNQTITGVTRLAGAP
jgi:hypothetical protein